MITIVFSVSVIVMLGLIFFRYFEIKRGKRLISKEFRDRNDFYIRKIALFCKYKFQTAQSFVVHIIKNILHLIYYIFIQSWSFIVMKNLKYINMVRGKGMLKNRGSASFFTHLEKDAERYNDEK